MSKQYIGIDIGTSSVKMAVCEDGRVRRLAHAPLPENMVRDGRILPPDEMSGFLREMKRKCRVPGRDAALILPEQAAFFRQIVLPAMTEAQLAINLPYEFRDYISHEKDKYFYDYAVLRRVDDEDGKPKELELAAAAVLKETIGEYRDMLRRANLRLKIAVPPIVAWSNLLRVRDAGRTEGPEPEYCLLDIGHTQTRLHLFHGRRMEMTKTIDYGCSLLDAAIAESEDVDQYLARTYKETNYENVQGLENCVQVYNALGIEVMKALNFHAYEHRDNHLTTVYYCGGGACIAPLIEAIGRAIALPLVSIASLLPPMDADGDDALLCAAAIGAAQL